MEELNEQEREKLSKNNRTFKKKITKKQRRKS